LSECESRCAFLDCRNHDLFLDRGLESLRVRGGRNEIDKAQDRVPIPFQACETKRTILAGAVLQNPARRCFRENKRLGTRMTRNSAMQIFPFKACAFVVYSSRAVAPLLLDTGPPGAFSFAELILQQSLPAHAPPSRA
jgi:hypothetical protein